MWALSDKILADIYQLELSKAYLIKICDISNGKKDLIVTKLRYVEDGYDYNNIKNEIRTNFFNEAYLILHASS
ncbi:MAG: hypothetical protein ACFFAO_01330 [Candidatus Hermodarchaeota archaeon]